MSRAPRKRWWGYAKSMARAYPGRVGQALEGTALAEFQAVEAAIEATRRRRDGEARMAVVNMVLIKGTHKIPGAAMMIPCSERTAVQWHGDFIREVAANFKCNGLR